jgi:hypothetical protein
MDARQSALTPAGPFDDEDNTRWHGQETAALRDLDLPYDRFSNRPFGVKHFQAIHHLSVDVTHGLALLFGLGTKALPAP